MGQVVVLKRRVESYKLNPQAPFPSQLMGAREMILAWRKEQEKKKCGQR